MEIDIEAIEYYLSEKFLVNNGCSYFRIDHVSMRYKIGIERRFRATENESVGDMSVKTTNRLLGNTVHRINLFTH